jgi:hypothetical protein
MSNVQYYKENSSNLIRIVNLDTNNANSFVNRNDQTWQVYQNWLAEGNTPIETNKTIAGFTISLPYGYSHTAEDTQVQVPYSFQENIGYAPNIVNFRSAVLAIHKERRNYILSNYTDKIAKDAISLADNADAVRKNIEYTIYLRSLSAVMETALDALSTVDDIVAYAPSFAVPNTIGKRSSALDFEQYFTQAKWDGLIDSLFVPILDVLLANSLLDNTTYNNIKALVRFSFKQHFLLSRAVLIEHDSPQLSAVLDAYIAAGLLNNTDKTNVINAVVQKTIGT